MGILKHEITLRTCYDAMSRREGSQYRGSGEYDDLHECRAIVTLQAPVRQQQVGGPGRQTPAEKLSRSVISENTQSGLPPLHGVVRETSLR